MLGADDPQGLDEVARRVAGLLDEPAPPELEPRPLPPRDPPARVAAVDGGSGVVVDAGAFLVGAYRGGAVLRSASGEVDRVVPAPRLALLVAGEGGDFLDAALAELDEPPAGARRRLEGVLDDLRSLDEMRAALDAVQRLDAGDVLLLDGTLTARDPVPSPGLLGRLVAKAADRGVAVVAVAKSTSQRVGRLPALQAARRAARSAGIPAPWSCALPGAGSASLGTSLACALNPASADAFRVDVAAPDGTDPRRVLAALAPLGNHPGYPGYPVPLALAHNAVHLDEASLADLAHRLRRRSGEAGLDAARWELTFRDFHDVLDQGA